MLDLQGGLCLICSTALTSGKTGMHVDHDHTTHRIRGILCHFCNTMLGCFKENFDNFRKAEVYLGKGHLPVSHAERPLKIRNATSRVKNLWYSYGLTEEVYQELLAAQSNLCAICSEVMSNPQIDHDHQVKRGGVRGLLCVDCNMGLGLAKETPTTLRNAVGYLVSHQTTQNP